VGPLELSTPDMKTLWINMWKLINRRGVCCGLVKCFEIQKIVVILS
jgi:hypothetical protein